MNWLVEQQQMQFTHDGKYHQDIQCLSRIDRLKHYGLHYSKYCGRLARNGFNEGADKTLVDWFLVVLSASTALQDKLEHIEEIEPADFETKFLSLCDASGRFCDACEKIDHLEDFRSIAVDANRDLTRILMAVASARDKLIPDLLYLRRQELAARAFYSR